MSIKKHRSKFIFTLFCLLQTTFASAQCLPAWKYYAPITVKNNAAEALNNYQVKIEVNTQTLISLGKMDASGKDLRFLDSASCTPLAYYIESGINTSATIVWVKLPSLAANASKTIRMFYGNNSATAQSNADSTFLIFDDFEATALNTDKWTTHGRNDTYTLNNGTLTTTAAFASSGGSAAIIRSKNTFASPIIVETMVTDHNGYYPSLALLHANSFDGYTLFYGNYTVSTGSMYQGRAYSNSGIFASNQTDTNNSPGTVNGLWQLAVTATGRQSSSWPGGNFDQNTFSSVSDVHVAAGALFTSAGHITMDWLRARTYASTDASSSIGTETANATSIMAGENQPYHINIYPNPATTVFVVNIDGYAGIFNKIELIDISGRAISTFTINTNTITIPVGGLPSGFYQVRLSGKNALTTQKLVVN